MTDEEKKSPVIYVGPTHYKDGLKNRTIYTQYPEAFVSGLAGKYPQLARLFVPVEKAMHAIKAAQTKGTPLYVAYNKTMEEK